MLQCVNCKEKFQYEKLKVCDRCKSYHYCSKECQTKDWNIHKKLCILYTVKYDGFFKVDLFLNPVLNKKQLYELLDSDRYLVHSGDYVNFGWERLISNFDYNNICIKNWTILIFKNIKIPLPGDYSTISPQKDILNEYFNFLKSVDIQNMYMLYINFGDFVKRIDFISSINIKSLKLNIQGKRLIAKSCIRLIKKVNGIIKLTIFMYQKSVVYTEEHENIIAKELKNSTFKISSSDSIRNKIEKAHLCFEK